MLDTNKLRQELKSLYEKCGVCRTKMIVWSIILLVVALGNLATIPHSNKVELIICVAMLVCFVFWAINASFTVHYLRKASKKIKEHFQE